MATKKKALQKLQDRDQVYNFSEPLKLPRVHQKIHYNSFLFYQRYRTPSIPLSYILNSLRKISTQYYILDNPAKFCALIENQSVKNYVAERQANTKGRLYDITDKQQHTETKKLDYLRKAVGVILEGLSINNVSSCGYEPAPKAETIDLNRGIQKVYRNNQIQEKERIYFSNLQTCGRVWYCPHCQLKITKQRQVEAFQALKWAKEKGYKIGMLTLTMRHNWDSDLETLINTMSKTWHTITTGKTGRNKKKEAGIKYYIRAFEIKVSLDSGYHPHYHIALIGGDSEKLESFTDFIINEWVNRVDAEKSAQDYRQIYDRNGIAKYINKWDMSREITEHHYKERGNSYNYLQLVKEILQGLAENTDDDFMEAILLLRDFAVKIHGKSTLQFSKNLKKDAGINEKTDEEITKEDYSVEVLIKITRAGWNRIRDYEKYEIIRAYINGGYDNMISYICDRGLKEILVSDYDMPNNIIYPDKEDIKAKMKNSYKDDNEELTGSIENFENERS